MNNREQHLGDSMKVKYLTIQGDTWDKIAKIVYGNEKYLDYLMSNNYHLLEYFVFPANVNVNTPALSEVKADSLPHWRN